MASLVGGIADADVSRDWKAFAYDAERADLAVVVLRDLQVEAEVERISTLELHHPELPILLVTRRDPAQLKAIGHVRLDQIVWISSMELRLPTAIARAAVGSRLGAVTAAIDGKDAVPRQLQDALKLACRRRRPVLTVTDLARAIGCDRRTLWYQWRKVTTEAQLKDLLAWCKLVHAVELKQESRSWREVAGALDTSATTLHALARRLTGRSLTDLVEGGGSTLFDRFNQDLAPHLFDSVPDVEVAL